jgi:hypothetical protein
MSFTKFVWLFWLKIFVIKITDKYISCVIARVISFFIYTKTYTKNVVLLFL